MCAGAIPKLIRLFLSFTTDVSHSTVALTENEVQIRLRIRQDASIRKAGSQALYTCILNSCNAFVREVTIFGIRCDHASTS